jgi:uncharacterized protein YjeT (DUF2065 family)
MGLLKSILRSGGLGLLLAGAILVARSIWFHPSIDCAGLSGQECGFDQDIAQIDHDALRFLGLALVLAGVALSWAARLLNTKVPSTTKNP